MVCVFSEVVRDCLIWRWIPNPPEHLEEGTEEKDCRKAHLGAWLLEGELSEEIYLFEHMVGGGRHNIIAFFSHFPFVPLIMVVWELGCNIKWKIS